MIILPERPVPVFFAEVNVIVDPLMSAVTHETPDTESVPVAPVIVTFFCSEPDPKVRLLGFAAILGVGVGVFVAVGVGAAL